MCHLLHAVIPVVLKEGVVEIISFVKICLYLKPVIFHSCTWAVFLIINPKSVYGYLSNLGFLFSPFRIFFTSLFLLIMSSLGWCNEIGWLIHLEAVLENVEAFVLQRDR
jgi:hypothetical protein